MNEHLNFWRNWSKQEKTPFFIGFVAFFILLGLTIFSWYRGLENIINWDHITELKEKIIQKPALYFDQFSFSAATPVWYVTEMYAPSGLHISPLVYILFLGCVLVGLSFILSGLSRLRGMWFLVGALLLGGVLVSFRSESLFLVSRNWPFLGAFIVAGGAYFISNIYAKKLDILKTSLIWLVVWGALLLVVNYSSLINQPYVSLAAYGVIGALVVAAIFIFLNAHEIISGLFVIVSGNSEKGKSSLLQVLVLGLVFFVNALLIYLENTQRIESSPYILHPLLIYFISAVLGLWGFKQVSEQKNWFTYRGVGVWIYLGMALVSSGVIALAYATANDPLIELIEDYISISFLAIGSIFFIYVTLNFLPLIKSGLAFSKVIYKPPFAPFLFARIVSIFVVLFLFSLKNRYSLHQLQSGLNNAIADFYWVEGDFKTAETYYKNGTNYDLGNIRSSISLASMATTAGDPIAAAFYYKQAGTIKPNVQASIGYSRALEQTGLFFDAVFTLKEDLKVFPNEHRIYNNLALLQAKAGAEDSVLVNLDQSLNLCKKCGPENVNFLAFWIENGKSEKLNEMKSLSQELDSYSYQANSMAINRIIGTETTLKSMNLPKDSALDMSRAALLFNTLSSPENLNSTSLDTRTLKLLQQKEVNAPLYEQLGWVAANQDYYRENKTNGLKNLSNLADSPLKLAPLYNQTLGLWLMREGAFTAAIKRLNMAGDSSSVKLLMKSELADKIKLSLKEQAEKLGAELDLNNYKEVLNKAPLNPYLLVQVSDLLAKDGKNLEAYNTVFYAQDLIPDSPEIIKNYIQRAIDLSMVDYAKNGLERLKPLVTPEEYGRYFDMIQKHIESVGDFN